MCFDTVNIKISIMEHFTIEVNNELFHISRELPDAFQTIYRVNKEHHYLFSLSYDRKGEWQVDDTAIISLDAAFVRAIGEEIERTDRDAIMA